MIRPRSTSAATRWLQPRASPIARAAARPGQPGTGAVGVAAPAGPGVVPAGVEQPQLDPAGDRTGLGRPGLAGTPSLVAGRASGDPGAPALHAGEPELMVPDLAQERFQHGDLALGLQAGLHPAQPAIALLQRDHPAAGGALAGFVLHREGLAGPAE